MNEIYLTSNSVTYAQKMQKVLVNNRINAKIVRPELRFSERGCAYAVLVSEKVFAEAAEVLRINRLLPIKAILVESSGNLREIKL